MEDQCNVQSIYSLKRSLSLFNFVTVSWEAFYAACYRNPAWQETQMCLYALFLWLQLDVDSCFMMYASLWFYFHSTVGRLFTACMLKWTRGLVVGNEHRFELESTIFRLYSERCCRLSMRPVLQDKTALEWMGSEYLVLEQWRSTLFGMFVWLLISLMLASQNGSHT